MPDMARIGLFYGSSTCYTEMVAEKIVEQLQLQLPAHPVDIFNIAEEPVLRMNDYRYLILGIPTWDYGELQEDWETVWDTLDSVNFASKQVALVGVGDQFGYPDWFLDALGYLWAKVRDLGAETHGYTDVTGFQFKASKALTDTKEQFVGLAIDEENQADLSENRIAEWCAQIQKEWSL